MCKRAPPATIRSTEKLAGFVTTMPSSPVHEYLGCPQVGCLRPSREFGGVANNQRGCPLVHDTAVPRENKFASGRYERPCDPLGNMGPLRGAQFEKDAL